MYVPHTIVDAENNSVNKTDETETGEFPDPTGRKCNGVWLVCSTTVHAQTPYRRGSMQTGKCKSQVESRGGCL